MDDVSEQAAKRNTSTQRERERESKVITQYRKLHSEELQDLYFSPHSVSVIKSLRTRCVRYAASRGAMEKVLVLSVQTIAGKRQCGRPRR